MADEQQRVRFVESTAETLATAHSRIGVEPAAGGEPQPDSTLIVHFARPLNDRDEFFRFAAEQFRLPFYFGRNWDALEECWRDLPCFRPVERVVLVFDTLPLDALPDQQRVLFDILRQLVHTSDSIHAPEWELIVASRLRESFEYLWNGSGGIAMDGDTGGELL